MLRLFSNIFPCFSAESPEPELPLQNLNPIRLSPNESPSAGLPLMHGSPPNESPSAGLPLTHGSPPDESPSTGSPLTHGPPPDESPSAGSPLTHGPPPDESPSAGLPPTHGSTPLIPSTAESSGLQPSIPPVTEQPMHVGHVPENLISGIRSAFSNHSKKNYNAIEEVKNLTGTTQNNGTFANSVISATNLIALNHPVNKLFGENSIQGLNNIPEAFITEISAVFERFPNMRSEINVFVKPSGILYVLGTVHSDPRCADEVKQVINHVKPNTVIVELCANRACHCPKHLGNVFQSTPKFTFKYLFKTIRQVGFLEAFIVLSDIYREMNTPITSSRNGLDLGTLGGELMSALEAGSNLEGCNVVLGDRPIDITVQRQASLMSDWTAVRVVTQVTLALMMKKFRPQLMANSDDLIFNDKRTYHVIVFERDLFLTYAMQTMADYSESQNIGEGQQPYRIITVVGASHLPGIQKFWMKVKPEIIPFILDRNV